MLKAAIPQKSAIKENSLLRQKITCYSANVATTSWSLLHFFSLDLGSNIPRIQVWETLRVHVRQWETAEQLNVSHYPCKVTPSKVDITINFTEAKTHVLPSSPQLPFKWKCHRDESWALLTLFCLICCYKPTSFNTASWNTNFFYLRLVNISSSLFKSVTCEETILPKK